MVVTAILKRVVAENGACEIEWEQAQFDTLKFLAKGRTWKHTWKYRIGDRGSHDPDSWWFKRAPSGAVVNQKSPADDAVYCVSREIAPRSPGDKYRCR